MDLDTIISELEKMARYPRGGGLIDATASAPKLLSHPRYQGSGNPRQQLATDIRSAISQLPRDTRKRAKGLLPIDYPNDSISGRMEHLGIDGYSSPAKRWHRKAILGRVANGLQELYDETPALHSQLSYSVQSIDIRVSEWASKGRPFARVDYHRHLALSWTLKCLVSDLRLFAFRLKTARGLKLTKLVAVTDGPKCTSVERLRGRGHDGDWYILILEDSLPTSSPVTLKCEIDYTATGQAPDYFDFVPETTSERLTLAYEANGAQGQVPCKCEAWNDKAKAKGYRSVLEPRMVKAYTGKISSYADDLWDEDYFVTRFRVPRAKSDRRYRLTWGSARNLLSFSQI
jgi:hypothetical protein